MKDNKKIKIGKLNFYIIDDDYIKYISNFDSHVAYNKNEKRPYIGIIIVVEKHYYFAPLFSPKIKHKKYKDNLTFFKIVSKTKKDLGIIRFTNMIPVPLEKVYFLSPKEKSYGYKRLLSEQYYYINKSENKEKIIKKAQKIYNIVSKKSKNSMSIFYKSLSCNFKLLEEKCLKYQEKQDV